MRAWATGAVQRVEAGDRCVCSAITTRIPRSSYRIECRLRCLRSTLNEDTQAFSLTTHIKAIERWMKADDQRMQQAIQDLNSMMKQLRWPPLPGPSCDTLPC